MQKKRIFIAINLPKQIREALEKEIAGLVLKLPESVRFTPPEFLHFTLAFLGDQSDEDVGWVVAALQEVVPQFAPPEIRFDRIVYGPLGRAPRMIWAVADEETSVALGEIKMALEDALASRGVRFERETRKYLGHLTLARFERAKELPEIETPFQSTFTPETVDLMESHLKHTGVEYIKLTATEFGE